MGNVVVAKSNEAIIINGGCLCFGSQDSVILVGAAGCKWIICQDANTIPLEMIQLEIQTVEAETVRGVRVSVNGVCCIKIRAFCTRREMELGLDMMAADHSAGDSGGGPSAAIGPERGSPQTIERTPPNEGRGVAAALAHDNSELVLNQKAIKIAAQHFLGKSKDTINEMLTKVLEGHQRQILGTLTVEELYKDRQAFSARVKDVVSEDLARMGFALVSYTVSRVYDSNGYMEALGATQSAQVKRAAAEGKSMHESEAAMKVAENKSMVARQQAEMAASAAIAENEQKTLEAQAARDRELKEAEFKQETDRASAIADQARRIEHENQEKLVVVNRTQQEVERQKIMIEVRQNEATAALKVEEGKVLLAEQRAKEAEMEAQGRSRAALVEAQNEAEARRVTIAQQAEGVKSIGEAEAFAIRQKGEAEAAAVAATLNAEAEALKRRAQAFREMGEAGVLSELIPQLPLIAAAISKPLEKAEKMVFISNDGSSGSRLTGDICQMLAQVPEAVEGVSGINIKKAIERIVERGGGVTNAGASEVDHTEIKM